MGKGELTEDQSMSDLGGLRAWARGSKSKNWNEFSKPNFGPLTNPAGQGAFVTPKSWQITLHNFCIHALPYSGDQISLSIS